MDADRSTELDWAVYRSYRKGSTNDLIEIRYMSDRAAATETLGGGLCERQVPL